MITPREKTSPLPLSYQLQKRLRFAIESGEKGPGTQLPSEEGLCRRYGVSHATVKQALSRLVSQQLLCRVRGKGTFVAELKVQKRSPKASKLHRVIQEPGVPIGSQVLNARIMPASVVVADKMGMGEGDSVALIHRLGLAADRRVAPQYAYLPQSRCPNLIERVLFGSLYERLHRYGLRPVQAHETYSAMALSQADAQLLDMPAGSPSLRCERVSRSADGLAIEYVQSVMRGDLY